MVTFDKKQLSDGSLHVTVAGKIDEKFDGQQIIDAAKKHKVVMHLGGVRSISSLGLRAFESFVASLLTGELILIHLSPAIANQLTMIPNLCQGAKIESAKLPFVCPACGAEKPHSVPWRPDGHVTNAPDCACGSKMELDGLPEQYLPMPS
jgi:anti-anti-sigma regulatory factor